MNTTFQFAGMTVNVYTNGRVYERGAYSLQYVTITHGYHKTEARWDHNCQNWNKRCGSPEYDEAVAKACGFIKDEPVESTKKVRKPREKKVSPVVEALRLPEGQKARCVGGKIVIVKVAPKEQKETRKVEKFTLTANDAFDFALILDSVPDNCKCRKLSESSVLLAFESNNPFDDSKQIEMTIDLTNVIAQGINPLANVTTSFC